MKTTGELSLSDYLRILRRQMWPALAVFSLVVGLAGLAGYLTPEKFTAEAIVLLRTESNEQIFPSVASSSREVFLRNPVAELEYAESGAFASVANAQTPRGAFVRPRYEELQGFRFQSNQLIFISEANSVADAIKAANVWANTYVETRQATSKVEVEVTIASIEDQISSLENQKAEILEPLAPFDNALLVATDADVINRLSTQRLTLRQSLDDDLIPVTTRLRNLNEDLADLRSTEVLLQREGISARVDSPAERGFASGAALPRNLALGIAGGLVLGLATALLLENLRTKIASRSDVERTTNIPILAEIPEFDPRKIPVDIARAPGTPYTEAMELLVTSLGLMKSNGRGNRFLITSSMPAEGKTTVVGHLTERLDEGSIVSAVVDADLRRPRLHHALGRQNLAPGLASVLSGEATAEEALRPFHPNSAVDIMVAGPPTSHAASLVRNHGSSMAFASLSRQYDLVLVDSPPIIPVADAIALGAVAVDHVILVVKAGQSKRTELAEAIRRLEEAGTDPVGIVLTGLKARRGSYHGYSYGLEEHAREAIEPVRARKIQAPEGSNGTGSDEEQLFRVKG